jgi:hypothetical protein
MVATNKVSETVGIVLRLIVYQSFSFFTKCSAILCNFCLIYGDMKRRRRRRTLIELKCKVLHGGVIGRASNRKPRGYRADFTCVSKYITSWTLSLTRYFGSEVKDRIFGLIGVRYHLTDTHSCHSSNLRKCVYSSDKCLFY